MSNQYSSASTAMHKILYLIHHVFLPPQLPQEHEPSHNNETALLDTVIESLRNFLNHVQIAEKDAVNSIIDAMENAKTVRHSSGHDGNLNEESLKNLLNTLCNTGGIIPLHIQAQNAGVIIRRASDTIFFESFELSPTNEAVISCKGRLRRTFPGTAWSVSISNCKSDGMISMIAHTLTTMSHQHADGTRPTVKKAGQEHDEERDTVHPRLVTELFGGLLRTVGSQADVPHILKNTREEVLWSNSLLPWRRSPFWLLLRVTMQLGFSHHPMGSPATCDLYKTFMPFLMGCILESASSYALPLDTIHSMSAKIGRRMLKLNMHSTTPGHRYLTDTLRKSTAVLDKRWFVVRSGEPSDIDLSGSTNINMPRDLAHQLPQLDSYIAKIATWSQQKHNSGYVPVTPYFSNAEHKLPNLHSVPSDYVEYDLNAFELWVALYLRTWLTQHKTNTDTCAELLKRMLKYHQVAKFKYSDNPEALSIMALTLLELWIGCDESAIVQCPLLKDYDPGFPQELLQSLLLPTKSCMQRVFQAEKYLENRRQHAVHRNGTVFREFGSSNCFAVRFFEQSTFHQRLLERIESTASDDREKKKLEFRNMKTKYHDLIRQCEDAVCEYVQTRRSSNDTYRSVHRSDCTKCARQAQAAALSIQIHEWPLPECPLQAKSLVFELDVPQHIASWRDASLFIIHDVYLSKYLQDRRPSVSYPLHTYEGLENFLQEATSEHRVGLLSDIKPHMATHRRSRSIAVSAESDVCLNNGLRFQYFDSSSQVFVTDLICTDALPNNCTYKLPTRSAYLQQFLVRTSTSPSGKPPNLVVAQQSICPDHLSLVEHNQLASLPLGYHLVWMNVLRELAMPSIDLKKSETGTMILQSIHQAGPRMGDCIYRATHEILDRTELSHILLRCLDPCLDRMTENWEASLALNVLVTLALRLLSLTESQSFRLECLRFLSKARHVSFKWLEVIRNQNQSATSDQQKTASLSQAAEIALICIDTFNLDEPDLAVTFDEQSNASIYIQCCIIIQGAKPLMSKTSNIMVARLLQRWIRLTHRASPILTDIINIGKDEFMNDAVTTFWTAYRPHSSWRSPTRPAQYWLVHEMASDTTGFMVHYSLLTGELLVNGTPISRLPHAYEQHATYKELFGHTLLEAVPSNLPAMQFSARNEYSGYVLHFRLDTVTDELRIHAIKNSKRYTLIPRSHLLGCFPVAFVQDYVHWYCLEDNCIQFRPMQDPWTLSASHWRLIRHSTVWRLVQDESFLFNFQNETAHTLSNYMAPLDQHDNIHCTYNESSAIIDIDVPRLQLSFYIDSARQFVRCRQLRDMVIDKSQSIGTLVGLTDKLVLKNMHNSNRVVVLPEGTVTYNKYSDHVRVSIDKSSVSRFHVYGVDHILGRLTDNGSLQSKLYLCYLHALTSCCRNDPLTSRTGTEQALHILQSAAVLSHDRLTLDNVEVLGKLARLTPSRHYYPRNLRVMQQVGWDSKIGFLAQHQHFYKSVKSLLLQAGRNDIFYPRTGLKLPKIDHVDSDLLERDSMRNAMFHRVGSGAEDHTTKHDHSYLARDRDLNSDAAIRTCIIAGLVHEGRVTPHQQPIPNEDFLWRFLSGPTVIFGPGATPPEWQVAYDAIWLADWAKLVAQYWCYLHINLSSSSRWFRIMWLSTLAFADKCDMSVLQVLVSTFTNSQVTQNIPPAILSFEYLPEISFQRLRVNSAANSAALLFLRCPEANLPRLNQESKKTAAKRRKAEHEKNQKNAVESFAQAVKTQWPGTNPATPTNNDLRTYLDVDAAMKDVRKLFQKWSDNRQLKKYVDNIISMLREHMVVPVTIHRFTFSSGISHSQNTRSFVGANDIFAVGLAPTLQELTVLGNGVCHRASGRPLLRLEEVIQQLREQAGTYHEVEYTNYLQQSLEFLQLHRSTVLRPRSDGIAFADYLQLCKQGVDAMYGAIRDAWEIACSTLAPSGHIHQMPQLSPILLVEQLSRINWAYLPLPWQQCITKYAVALTKMQQAQRLALIQANSLELDKELSNAGHENWDPMQNPESLLLEVESGIMIRDAQDQVAEQMKAPKSARNSVMQLNMGEGKSSVLVPIISASLADGSHLARVIVTRPQSRQMFNIMAAKLGGLLARRIYRMPFSRDLRFGTAEAETVRALCIECMENGGILLIQPEHILSFQLMVAEYSMSTKVDVGRALRAIEQLFDASARDIIDESDEVYSVKFELIYTMGLQQPIEMSPARWIIVQQVLDIVRDVAPGVLAKFPESMEICEDNHGIFPRMRIFHHDAWQLMSARIVRHICDTGLHGFPIARQNSGVRDAAFKYITGAGTTSADIDLIENENSCSLWNSSYRLTLLLLRGLFDGGVLFFALNQKRWRVNYGLTVTRTPSTNLAVPYTAKDCPSLRSEFSHPDVVIVLTLLSHYYDGLLNDALFDTIRHLLRSDQPDVEYQEWVKDITDLPLSYQEISGINPRDHVQCVQDLFPFLRRSKKVVDYFLANIIFPKQMRAFPSKLSASGWDIGRARGCLVTGFSGTNDSRKLLPLDVGYLDLVEQKHTNALVLEYLLQHENTIALMSGETSHAETDAERLLAKVVTLMPAVRVILDVGAQIIELDNLAVAKRWLSKHIDEPRTRAVVFFDDDDELCVLDRRGRIELLQTSTFVDCLDQCLVYLDEAHTRGTDLKLPQDYRAAVTLGPNMTKDKLIQACMRMRKLGQGQSVVFVIPEEIRTKMVNQNLGIDLAGVLLWSISETHQDLKRSIGLWAGQGIRKVRQSATWTVLRNQTESNLIKGEAEELLEDESLSLEQRYRPSRSVAVIPAVEDSTLEKSLDLIRKRCSELGCMSTDLTNLQEEQERELSPETEQEREVQRPAPAEPAKHSVHPDLLFLVRTGLFKENSRAWRPAFETMEATSAAKLLNVNQFSHELLVTTEFARTVLSSTRSSVVDDYLRPVQWVMTSGLSVTEDGKINRLLVVSPYEAQELYLHVRNSDTVTLHVYAPRSNFSFRPLDTLDLFTIGRRPFGQELTRRATILLNLFAGQLYYQSFQEYTEVCDYLNLAWEKADKVKIAADGFIIPQAGDDRLDGFLSSPVPFLQNLMTKIRRKCVTIGKTHIGKMLEGKLLGPGNFIQPHE